MNRRRGLLVFSLIVFIIGASISLASSSVALAQAGGFPTAAEALEVALGNYLEVTSQDSHWQMGEVEQRTGYAIAVARAGNAEGNYQDYVLLLAQIGGDGSWSAVAPKVVAENIYNVLLNNIPTSLLNEYEKSYYYLYGPEVLTILDSRAFSLHHFPWPIRQTARLTQKDSTYHVNQLDFVLRDSADVYASKPGVVVFVKESSGIGGCDIDFWPYANMVVIQHGAAEFSWYVHLAQNSVPVKIGDLIGYGTKIGEQGNTGFACGSSGLHLHFMTSEAVPASWPDPSVPNFAPWPPGGSIVTVDFIEASWSALVVDQIYESQNAPPPGMCNEPISQAIFYDNTYCNGQIFQQTLEGLVTLELIGLDERIESIALPLGWSLGLYKNENEIGPSVCLNQTDQMLWDNQFSDSSVVANQISWFRLYQQPNCPFPDESGIKFFPDQNFGGIPVWGMVGARFTNGPNHLAGSIYIPDGYSAKIYDQDDAGGNSLCFSSSVLNLSDFGWDDHLVESVELIEGNDCETDPGSVPQPVLINPLNNSIVYGPNGPELCWQIEGSSSGYVFNVLIFNDDITLESGWMPETCWTVESLAELYGDYSWRVQAKNTVGEISQWSLTNIFSYSQDTTEPIAQVLTPEENSIVKWPRANIFVNAIDNESGVARVHFFAWYDDGAGAGYDWHYLGVDEDPLDGWRYVWNLTVVESTDSAVWVYVEDFNGNFGSVFVNGIEVVDSVVNENGYEYRDTKTEETFQGSNEIETNPGGENQPKESEKSQTSEGNSQSSAMGTNQDEKNYVPAVPGLVKPGSGQVFFGNLVPELCWQGGDEINLEYEVEVIGEQTIQSPWMGSTCWQPSHLSRQFGAYEWRVRVRSGDGTPSLWSNKSSFMLVEDDEIPFVRFVSPTQGQRFGKNVLIELDVYDLISGVERIYLMAWYDSGAGSGYAWHTIAELTPEDESSVQYLWNIDNIYQQDTQLWVYVRDQAGNLASSQVSNLTINGELRDEEFYRKAMLDLAVSNKP